MRNCSENVAAGFSLRQAPRRGALLVSGLRARQGNPKDGAPCAPYINFHGFSLLVPKLPLGRTCHPSFGWVRNFYCPPFSQRLRTYQSIWRQMPLMTWASRALRPWREKKRRTLNIQCSGFWWLM
jgi:hypothetical protein